MSVDLSQVDSYVLERPASDNQSLTSAVDVVDRNELVQAVVIVEIKVSVILRLLYLTPVVEIFPTS